jgi:hypothetical protein
VTASGKDLGKTAGHLVSEMVDKLEGGEWPPRRGRFTNSLGGEVGPLLGDIPLWDSDEKSLLNVAGFWLNDPWRFFEWQKLGIATVYPLASIAFNAAYGDNGIWVGSGADHGSDWRHDAAEIVIDSVRDCLFFSGGILSSDSHSIKCEISHYGVYNPDRWTVTHDGSDIPIDSEKKSEFWFLDEPPKTNLPPTSFLGWLEESPYSGRLSTRGKASLFELLSDQALSGAIELRGRIESAISETVILDSDWFVTPAKSGDVRGSIKIGDSLIWNVEIRLNQSLIPSYLKDHFSTAGTKKRPTIRNAVPNDILELRYWAKNILEKDGTPPTVPDFEAWATERGLNRESLRNIKAALPDELKRKRGERGG